MVQMIFLLKQVIFSFKMLIFQFVRCRKNGSRGFTRNFVTFRGWSTLAIGLSLAGHRVVAGGG